jgi:uncharacterized Zn finger protein (UPF0148 family)
VTYLTCPECGLTLFDRNPLTSPRRCPRCSRQGAAVELEWAPFARGRAAASGLGGQQAEPAKGAEQPGS